jgi:hypothetical protein
MKWMSKPRPSTWLGIIAGGLMFCQLILIGLAHVQVAARTSGQELMRAQVQRLGLSDICIATEARYIRHLAVTDQVAPFMDHPLALEYFPSGSLWAPVISSR